MAEALLETSCVVEDCSGVPVEGFERCLGHLEGKALDVALETFIAAGKIDARTRS